MNSIKRITPPLTDEMIKKLKTGDSVVITGVLYTARDAAHKRMFEGLERGEPLPLDVRGQIIFYAGPSPAKPGKPIGSIGPTTSGRMDAYTPGLLEAGLKGMIGKGNRSDKVLRAMQKYVAVYLGAIGGTAALLSRCVQKAEIVAYEDLGPEAIMRLDVVNFPAIVVNDSRGGDLYQEGMKQYRIIAGNAQTGGPDGH
jgi:fumarate hydratase subunit beta